VGCDFPAAAYRSEERNENGKRPLIFMTKGSLMGVLGKIDIPCGKCTGCRLDRANQWKARLMHERQFHDYSCFLTLTYSPEAMPVSHSLVKPDFQNFMKRYRAHSEYHYNQKLRFYACGEYSPLNLHPHYHAIIFGHDFPDKIHHSTKNNKKLYTSPTLSSLWPHGFSTIGSVDPQSCGYVARYTLKKMGGPKADPHYFRQSPVDGNSYRVEPEFSLMSTRPGIGSAWIDKYKTDVYPSGFIVIDGKPQPAPRFYKLRLTKEEQEHLKRQASQKGLPKSEKTNWRRDQRARVRDARIQNLKRNLGD